MEEYERGFIDGIKSKVSAELTPTLINVSKTMLEMLKPVLSTALENALNDNNAIPAAGVQPVNQWISVKERLPEAPEEGLGVRYSDCCLVCDSYDWCGMAYYLTDDKESWWEFADAQNKVKIDWTEITHWMPLPEPPKDGDAE